MDLPIIGRRASAGSAAPPRVSAEKSNSSRPRAGLGGVEPVRLIPGTQNRDIGGSLWKAYIPSAVGILKSKNNRIICKNKESRENDIQRMIILLV